MKLPLTVPTSAVARNALVLIAVVASGAALYWLRDILTPLAMAIFLMIMIDGRLLDCLQHAAGFDCDRAVDRIDGADSVHARQADQDGGAACVRNARAAMAGVTALRHHCHTVLRAETDDCGDFIGRRRTHHARGRTTIPAAPVDEVRRRVIGGSQHIPGADNGAELLNQILGIQGMTPGRASVRAGYCFSAISA